MCKYCDDVINLEEYKQIIESKTHVGNSIFTNELWMELESREYTDDGEDHFYLSIDATDGGGDEFLESEKIEIKYCPFCGVDLKEALLRRRKEEE